MMVKLLCIEACSYKVLQKGKQSSNSRPLLLIPSYFDHETSPLRLYSRRKLRLLASLLGNCGRQVEINSWGRWCGTIRLAPEGASHSFPLPSAWPAEHGGKGRPWESESECMWSSGVSAVCDKWSDCPRWTAACHISTLIPPITTPSLCSSIQAVLFLVECTESKAASWRSITLTASSITCLVMLIFQTHIHIHMHIQVVSTQ